MGDRQQQVATHDNDAAIPDGILTTDHAVSNPSAGQSHEVDSACIESVYRGRGRNSNS